MAGSPITTEDPQFQGNIYVARNITERKRAERRIRYLARYDTLTKMPNRMQFQHLLQQAIARSRRSQAFARAAVSRSRPLQGGQRHLRSRGRRPHARDPERAADAQPEQGHGHRPARRRRVRDVHRRPSARRRQPRGHRRARAHAARRDQPHVLREPAGGLSDGERRRRDLPLRCRERDRSDPQRRCRHVSLEAERRQLLRVLSARDERRRGRAPDAQEQAAPRARARRAGDPLSGQGGSARRARGRRRGAAALAPARTRRHLALAFHSARRGNEPDHGYRRVGHESRLHATTANGRRRCRSRAAIAINLSLRQLKQASFIARCARRVPQARGLAHLLRAGGHRNHADDGSEAHHRAARTSCTRWACIWRSTISARGIPRCRRCSSFRSAP